MMKSRTKVPEVLLGLERVEIPEYGVVYKVPEGVPWPPRRRRLPQSAGQLTAVGLGGVILVTIAVGFLVILC